MNIKKKIKKFTLGIALAGAISGCGGGNGSSNRGTNNFVNNPPIPELEYFSSEAESGGGYTSFTNGNKFYEFNIFPEKPSIDTYLYDLNSGDGLAMILDNENQYLPQLYNAIPQITENNSNRQQNSSIDWIFLLTNGQGFNFGNVILNTFDLSSPEFDLSNNQDSPEGSVYLGDWSYNDLQNLNTTLKTSSCFLARYDTSGISQYACGTFATSGTILSNINQFYAALDFLGFDTNFDFNQKYPRYLFSSQAPFFMTIGKPHDKNSSIPMELLFPLQKGTEWTYKLNGGVHEEKMWVENSYQDIDGNDFAVLKDLNGVKGFYGFSGDNLKFYGFEAPDIGKVMYNPPVIIGDKNVNIGRIFNTQSQIDFQDNPQVNGTISLNISYDDRGDLVLYNDSPYGDCFRARENATININVGGDNFIESDESTRFYGKNVGIVRETYNTKTGNIITYDLYDKGNHKENLSLDEIVNTKSFFPGENLIRKLFKKNKL